jgi:HlyD family secretion protein
LFDGTVVEVSPLPDVALANSDDTKVYTTKVKIDNAIAGMRPGMATQVEFLLANRENVLAVPFQAVVRYEGKWHVAVKKPGGGIELRDVNVGLSNDKLVEITHGIESGDTVVLNPAALTANNPSH